MPLQESGGPNVGKYLGDRDVMESKMADGPEENNICVILTLMLIQGII